MKNIKELTLQEAKEILEFIYPNRTELSNPKKYDYWVTGISFEPVITEEGHEQLTLGMRSIIGVEYHNGQDNCILYFDNSKVILWLYNNGYDIKEFLENNKHFSEMQRDFCNFAFNIEQLSKGEDYFVDGYKHNWNLDFVKNKCKELLDKYYFKDYK